jgi:hypothetical protein
VLNNVLESVPNLENLNTIDPESTAKPSYTRQQIPEVIESYEVESLSRPTVIEDLSTEPQYQPKRKINIWAMLACVLLAMLAGLQTIYSTRTKIAAEYPQFKSYLVQACSVLKCEVELPKNLDFFTIDDSDMQEDDTHQDVINFSSLLINNAPYTQAYPNIELTLTDTDDQPVLRKVIKPSEYLATSTNVDAGIDSREEERINLAINVTDLAVAGYRVLLVY